ncbi:MAG: tyrosine-type recombinase/integrase [Candidatus Melainabacteria bacterium]|nr:tyrosine-type recombinase/integrase [Candidatus Melainabacteria bacterium]
MTYLDTDTIAKKLGLSSRTIQNYCKDGFLPSERQWQHGKLTYQIDIDSYHDWKRKHFRGVKHGSINRFSRLDRELGKNQIRELMPEWLDWCATGKLGGKPVGPRTIEIYDYYFNYFLKRLGRNPKLPIVSVDTFRKVLGTIPVESFSTRRHVYDAVMSFTKYLIETNGFEVETREKLRKLRPKRFLPARKTVLTEAQLEKIIKAVEDYKCYSVYCKQLNLTLIKFMVSTGLRTSEVCNLKLADVDMEAGVIKVILGKGNKNRKVGISSELQPVLVEYLKLRLKYRSNYFFVNKQGNQLDPQYLSKRFQRISKKKLILISPHMVYAEPLLLSMQTKANHLTIYGLLVVIVVLLPLKVTV